MKFSQALVLFMGVFCGISFAQDNPFNGNWKANWQGKFKPAEAIVVIDKNGGSWTTLDVNKFNKCVGIKVPIAINSLTPEGFTMKLNFSEIVQGCDDITMKFHRVDEKTMLNGNGKTKLVRD